MPRWQAAGSYVEGLRTSVVENATAYGFSIMITATFGVVNSLEDPPGPWAIFLFATGAVAGFTIVLAAATKGLREEDAEAQKGEVEMLAAAMNFFSVLVAVGAAALVAWLGEGWYVWLAGPVAASATYTLLNGLEFALAEQEEED